MAKKANTRVERIRESAKKIKNLDKEFPVPVEVIKEVRQTVKDVQDTTRENKKAIAEVNNEKERINKERESEEHRHKEAMRKMDEDRIDQDKAWEAFDSFKDQVILDHTKNRESDDEAALAETRRHELKLLELMKKK